MRELENIHLVGMPGSGKSSVGRGLARRLGLKFADADEEIVARTGVSIATIFELEGEEGFRAREAQVLADLCARTGQVIATGGGAILRADNRERLRQRGVVVYLHASLDHLRQRTRRDTRRPLLQTGDPAAVLAALLEKREPLYRELADVVVETGRQSVGKLALEIIAALAHEKLWPGEMQAPALPEQPESQA
jgi:shikimate kinase